MVNLYRDPNGVHVFSAHDEALIRGRRGFGALRPNDTNETLQKKISELETVILNYKVVCCGVCVCVCVCVHAMCACVLGV